MSINWEAAVSAATQNSASTDGTAVLEAASLFCLVAKFQDAEALATKVLGWDSPQHHAYAYRVLGDVRGAQLVVDEAVEMYTKALDAGPTKAMHGHVVSGLVSVCVFNHKPVPPLALKEVEALPANTTAAARCKSLLALRTTHPRERDNGCALAKQLVRQTDCAAVDWVLFAEYSLAGNDLDAVLGSLQKCFQRSPHNTYALLLYHTVALRLGWAFAGLHAAEEVVRVAPTSYVAVGRLGQALVETGQADKAKRLVLGFIARVEPTPERTRVLLFVGTKLHLKGHHGQALDCASQALTLPYNGDTRALTHVVAGGCLAASRSMWPEAERHLLAAAASSPPLKPSAWKGDLANLYKDWGRLGEALALLKELADGAEPGDPQPVVNYALCMEYAGRADQVMAILRPYLDSVPVRTWRTKEQWVPLLLAVKTMWSAPNASEYAAELPGLLTAVGKTPVDMVLALREHLPTHWAFPYFIRKLQATWPLAVPGGASTAPPTVRDPDSFPAPMTHPTAWPSPPRVLSSSFPHRPLFVLGDSHVLSYAWRTLTWGGETRLLVPRLVTGLKAWHLRPGTQFLTHSVFHGLMRSLDLGEVDVLVCAGEIDCREGLPAAVSSGKYPTTKAAAVATADAYVSALRGLHGGYGGVRFLVLPVAPSGRPGTHQRQGGAWFNHTLRTLLPDTAAADVVLVDVEADLLDGVDGRTEPDAVAAASLRPEFVCDGIHLSPAVVAQVEAWLARA